MLAIFGIVFKKSANGGNDVVRKTAHAVFFAFFDQL